MRDAKNIVRREDFQTAEPLQSLVEDPWQSGFAEPRSRGECPGRYPCVLGSHQLGTSQA